MLRVYKWLINSHHVRQHQWFPGSKVIGFKQEPSITLCHRSYCFVVLFSFVMLNTASLTVTLVKTLLRKLSSIFRNVGSGMNWVFSGRECLKSNGTPDSTLSELCKRCWAWWASWAPCAHKGIHTKGRANPWIQKELNIVLIHISVIMCSFPFFSPCDKNLIQTGVTPPMPWNQTVSGMVPFSFQSKS